MTRYKDHVDELDYSNVKLPLYQYGKIEKHNSININVLGYEDKHPFPVYMSKETNENMLNLLLITEGVQQ